ncbi:protein-L-isoaspartate(D-aspartate) O-methyltransferase [Halostella litorea]|uniref:protein-L-isoaspartate(D-aspartate) O-methyltransferase n=1 Tax=Halostella litorea TaxID=2528831 RepID=UPI0010930020|nr:protein-L-isoaspartate(D-aspartate) O-methyltransferase [Halostella litorea]
MFGGGTDYEGRRNKLVDRLERRVDDEPTLAAMRAVPRHEFVPERRRDRAYEDHPLPIADDQTISAPHMVAIMTDLLDLAPGDEVLEVGTGCGYHAAVTAEVVGPENVYSVEYGAELAEGARATLADLGYGDVSVRHGDGREGWAEHAPYDAAYFTCAVPSVPDAVVEQVRDGGRVLAPVGTRRQTLQLLRKTADGVEREDHGGVRFVTLRGDD